MIALLSIKAWWVFLFPHFWGRLWAFCKSAVPYIHLHWRTDVLLQVCVCVCVCVCVSVSVKCDFFRVAKLTLQTQKLCLVGVSSRLHAFLFILFNLCFFVCGSFHFIFLVQSKKSTKWWNNMTMCQLLWIVFLGRSCGACVSGWPEQMLHLIRTEELKTTVYVCTSCTVCHCRQQVWILTLLFSRGLHL